MNGGISRRPRGPRARRRGRRGRKRRIRLVFPSSFRASSLLTCCSQKSHGMLAETSSRRCRRRILSYLSLSSLFTCPVGAVPHATWLAVADGGARGISGNRTHAVGIPDDGRPGTDSRWRRTCPRGGCENPLLIGGDDSLASASPRDVVTMILCLPPSLRLS